MALVLVVLALVVVVAWLTYRFQTRDIELDEATYRAAAELHAIRRRLDVAGFKSQLGADAAQLRRELRDGLDATDAQE